MKLRQQNLIGNFKSYINSNGQESHAFVTSAVTKYSFVNLFRRRQLNKRCCMGPTNPNIW